MADNTTLNARTSTGDTIATDDIGGIKHQRVKVQHGEDGSATDVSADSPLPVTMSGVSSTAPYSLSVTDPTSEDVMGDILKELKKMNFYLAYLTDSQGDFDV